MTTYNDTTNYQPVNHGIVIGGTNSSINSVAPLTGTKILRTMGLSADPAYSTANYPSTAGTAGNLATSNGTNFGSSTPNLGFTHTFTLQTTPGNPVDATTYFLAQGQSLTAFSATGQATTRFNMGKNFPFVSVRGIILVGGTLGSTENCTLQVTNQSGTTVNLTTTLKLNTASQTFSYTPIFTGGAWFEVKLVCPTWVTNPTNVSISMAIYGQ